MRDAGELRRETERLATAIGLHVVPERSFTRAELDGAISALAYVLDPESRALLDVILGDPQLVRQVDAELRRQLDEEAHAIAERLGAGGFVARSQPKD